MPTGTFQIAVCQLECHPALTVGEIDYLAEPILPASRSASLVALSRFSLSVADLQEECKRRYTEWNAKRVAAVLSKLASATRVPELIVFPEAAISFDLLPPIRDFAVKHGVTILAGTHTLELTKQRVRQYKSLGIEGQVLKAWGEQPIASMTVLPIFSCDRSYFHLKAVPSVFEITDVKRPITASNILCSFRVRIGNQTVNLVPLVCAEALQRHQMPADCDLIVICAHNSSAQPFEPFIRQHAGNRIPVVLANDGRYGGSGVHVLIDNRIQTWWWGEPLNGLLPKGDGILVVEVDWDHLAPQVGVADPRPSGCLIACNAIVFETTDEDTRHIIQLLRQARQQSDNTTQAELLSQAMDRTAPPIQQTKMIHLRRLAEKHGADTAWWNALGDDCIVSAVPDLRGLERELCAISSQRLQQLLTSDVIHEETAMGRVALLAQSYRKQAAIPNQQQNAHFAPPVDQKPIIINRADECEDVRSCLANPKMPLCLVHGLSAVGKTAVIETAIGQAGYRNVYRIPIAPDTTPEFLALSILQQLSLTRIPEITDAVQAVRSELPTLLPRNSTIIIERAHFLTADFIWRDPSLPQLLAAIVEAMRTRDATLILESDVFLEVQLPDPSHARRITIRGLPEDDGLVFLDQQFRRAGLDPNHYGQELRRAIVKGLGGHPGAIILGSEYVEEVGIEQVVGDISSRRGVHGIIVKKIVRRLHLSEEQSFVLSLLSLARAPIPASVLATSIRSFNPTPIVRQLQKLALVERFARDFVAIAALVAGYAELCVPTPEEAASFHEAAAREFARLAEMSDTSNQLRWAVEARYHAYAVGKPDLAPDTRPMADGALGALQMLVDRNEYEKARLIVDRLLTSYRTAEILQLGAIVYARLGKCAEGLTLAKESVSKQPQRVWVLTEVGRCALHVHQVEVAEDAVKIAKATGTDSPFIAVLEGKIFQRKEDMERAIAAFRRGTEISQYDGWPFFYLGRALVREGELPQAIEVLHRGENIETSRSRPRTSALSAIRTQLIVAYLLQDDIDNAQRWLELVADDGTAEVARAMAYVDLRSGAKDAFQRTMARLDPQRVKSRHDKAQIHLFRGLFYLNSGNREQASEEFNRAHEADPRNVFVLLRWAAVLIEIARDASGEGEHEASRVCAERAKEVANKVLEFDKDNAQALALLEGISDEFNVL